jgi:hypothetical protein
VSHPLFKDVPDPGAFGLTPQSFWNSIKTVWENTKRLNLLHQPTYYTSMIDSRGSFSSLLDAIGTTSATLYINSTVSLTAALTVPSNIALKVLQGGGFTGPYTLTPLGGFSAGDYQIFFGGATADLRKSKAWAANPNWWGTYGTGGRAATGTATSGTNIYVTTDSPFTSRHVGATFLMRKGNTGSTLLSTTITGVTDANTVTLAATIQTTVSGSDGEAVWGHDDQAALTRALATGVQVQIFNPHFLASGLSLTTWTEIQGFKGGGLYFGTTMDPITIGAGADRSHIEGLRIVGMRSGTSFGIAVGIVDRVTIQRCKIEYAGIGVRATSSSASPSKFLNVVECDFLGCGNAINVQGFTNSKFNDNWCRSDTAYGDTARGLVITHLEDGEVCGNIVEGHPTETFVGILFRHERTLGYYVNRNIKCHWNTVLNIREEGISVDRAGPSRSFNGADYSNVDISAVGATTVTVVHPVGAPSWTTNQLVGSMARVMVDPGTGWQATGSFAHIISNTASTFTIRRAWSAAAPVVGTNHVEINTPHIWRDGGTATGGSTTTLVMAGANWDTNQHQNYEVYLTSGTGRGQWRKVASNTSDTLTFEYPVQVAPVPGTTFTICAAMSGIDISHNLTKGTGRQGVIFYGGGRGHRATHNTVLDAQQEAGAPAADNDFRAGITSWSVEASLFGTTEYTPSWYHTIEANTVIAYNISGTNGRNGIQVGGFNPAGVGASYNGFVAARPSFGLKVTRNTMLGEGDKGVALRAVEASHACHNTVDGYRGDSVSEDEGSANNVLDGNIATNCTTPPSFRGTNSKVSHFGTGSPEGVITAQIGAEYTQTDGGASSIRWTKVSGTGNTGWRAIVHPLTGSITWDPGNMAADGDTVSTTLTVTGAAVGDQVSASLSTIGANNVLISAHVQASDIVRVVLMNKTGGALDIASGTLAVKVWQ